MEQGNRLPKSLEDRIDLVDSWILNPENRSKKVWAALQTSKEFKDITNWDIICFCAAYLKNSVAVYPWLLQPIKQLGRLVFNAHYLATEETGLLLDLNLNGIQQESKSAPEGARTSNGIARFE